MDFYQKNPTTLRRLLTKRQNPCTQIFKSQPSNPTNGPMPAMNLSRNDIFTTQEEKHINFSTQNQTENTFPPTHLSQNQSQTSQTTPSTFDSSSTQIEEEDDEDGACYDTVQKKIKTTMLTPNDLKSERRVSYEEEKEESEQHSTSCETRSDFNMAEPGDFMFSPSMTHLPSKNLTEIKLDGNDAAPQHESFHLNSNTEENPDLIKISPSRKEKVKCNLNHQCEVEVSNPKKNCPRCADLLHECREFAKKNEGSCLNEVYDETIRYQCIKGHCWSLNHKNARRRWCAQCAKEQRAFLKKKCEEEKIEREKQEEEHQKKLFEEAKKQAMKDNMKQQQQQQPFGFSGTNNGYGSSKPMSALEYFQRIDYEIESLAKKYTLEFMSQKTFTGEINYQQILQVYKIVIMPEEILQTYMFNLNADTLRSEFRRMAKIIHPDKNKHPQAGNAFQKIYKVYEVALSRLEGTQQKM
jgi:hypothetical protein